MMIEFLMRYVKLLTIHSLMECKLSLKFICFTDTYEESSRSEVFSGKGVLRICSKFTAEHPCQSVI